MEKEQINQLVEDTLNSIDGIKRAEANPFLYSKTKERASGKKTILVEKFSPGFSSKLFLAFAILVIINAFTLLIYTSNSTSEVNITSTKQDINSFINEYSLKNTNYNY